jgi:murein DD-endopeptidase MepM/ murein hydrolase activator NlpD
MVKRHILVFAACALSCLVFAIIGLIPVQAQENEGGGPVYVVQEGDTLFNIALRFGVTMDELIAANQIPDPNNLGVGASVTIPGLEGVEGVLTTGDVAFGETLRSLSRRFKVPLDSLARLNRIVSPAELFVGAQVILPLDQQQPGPEGRTMLLPGQSLLELAVAEAANPWTLATLNELEGAAEAVPGEVLFTPVVSTGGPGALPESIERVEIDSLPLIQGETATVFVHASEPLALEGRFSVFDLRNGNSIESTTPFFEFADGVYAGLHGVHAMTSPGFYPFELTIRAEDGSETRFSQNLYVGDGGYVYDPSLAVDPKTLDPAATGPEDELWNGLGKTISSERLWQGLFQSPAMFPDCWTSRFGSRRSYNEGPYIYFHTGLDFCGGVGLEVRAPAPGRVTFAGPLIVRGNAIMLDHGWGVNTGYMHLSEILVEEGDFVEAGQVIGLVGGTGRVTGAHLHWEVWVGGFQVNPASWLEAVFPQELPSPGGSAS